MLSPAAWCLVQGRDSQAPLVPVSGSEGPGHQATRACARAQGRRRGEDFFYFQGSGLLLRTCLAQRCSIEWKKLQSLLKRLSSWR